MNRGIEYWRAPGALTDLRPHSSWVAELPDDPVALREIVATLIIHRAHPSFVDSGLTHQGAMEDQLRPAADIVDAIRSRVPEPTQMATRPETDRVVGVCRHFAVVLVALLRAKGVPARARVGMAAYFEAGLWDNHWITEWWNGDEQRWVPVDAQIDDETREALPFDVNPDDLPDGAFLNAGENWIGVRSGSIDADACGITGGRGIEAVRCNVVRDLAALNKIELLAWDIWGLPVHLYGPHVSTALADAGTDIAAHAVADPTDINRLQELYADDRFRVPTAVISLIDSGPVMVELDL